MPKFIWKNFPQTYTDAIELSPTVIQVAYDFFYLPKDPRMQVHATDACAFIETTPKNYYDAIFIDLFAGDEIAECVGRASFFSQCKETLTATGVVIWNCWRRVPSNFIPQFDATFPESNLMVQTRESPNLIFYGSKSRWPLFEELEKRYEAHSCFKNFVPDLYNLKKSFFTKY